MDQAFPMGCSDSCLTFKWFSSFLEWVLRTLSGLVEAVHFLDVFFFCLRALKTVDGELAFWFYLGS